MYNTCTESDNPKGDLCTEESHDIALVRLSMAMPGMKRLKLSFVRPKLGDITVMAGTGECKL